MNGETRMRAAILYGKRDIRMEEAPMPEVGCRDVLIEMRVAGISGIEPIIYEGGYVAKDGIIAGFQAAGVVAEVADKVRSVEVGQRVSFDPNLSCGYCRYCKRGQTLFCENLQGYGVHRTGTFADYFAVPESNVYPLPDGMPFEDAPLIEHTSCVLHAVELSQMAFADVVVVLGAGLVGNLFIQMAAARGAATVIAVDVSGKKLAKAAEVGADHAIDASKGGVVAAVLERTGGRGADVVFDTAGVPAALEEAPAYAAKGGTIVVFATHPKDAAVSIRPFELLEKEIRIQAAYCNPLTYGKALDMIAGGKINVQTLISDEVDLDDLVKGIEKKRDEDLFYVLVRNRPRPRRDGPRRKEPHHG